MNHLKQFDNMPRSAEIMSMSAFFAALMRLFFRQIYTAVLIIGYLRSVQLCESMLVVLPYYLAGYLQINLIAYHRKRFGIFCSALPLVK